ncbi:MAG: hypothetical protein ACRDSR_19005 [Pseudonocardiaceae bacterium]
MQQSVGIDTECRSEMGDELRLADSSPLATGAAPLLMVRELCAINGQLSRHGQASSPDARRAVRASVSQRRYQLITRHHRHNRTTPNGDLRSTSSEV